MKATIINIDVYFGTVIYCRLSEFQRAKLEYERLQGLKEEARLEREQKIKEREIAIVRSKQIRLEGIKKLTKKGHPVMSVE